MIKKIVATVVATAVTLGVCAKNSYTTNADIVQISLLGETSVYFNVDTHSTRELKTQLEGIKLLTTVPSESQPGNTSLSNVNTIEAYKQIDLSGDQLTYLANTVQHEIGSAPDVDRTSGDPRDTPMSNVISVILNRIICQNNDFKNVNTVYEVVSQPGQFQGIQPYLNLNVYGYGTYAKAPVYDAIKYVLEHGDTTGGCLYFHSDAPQSFFLGPTVKHQFTDCAGHYFYTVT